MAEAVNGQEHRDLAAGLRSERNRMAAEAPPATERGIGHDVPGQRLPFTQEVASHYAAAV